MKNEDKNESPKYHEIDMENFDYELNIILNKLLAPKTKKREVHLLFTSNGVDAQCNNRKWWPKNSFHVQFLGQNDPEKTTFLARCINLPQNADKKDDSHLF